MENPPPEIPVLFEGGQKWITGLTPKTTCDDVVHSLLINAGCPIPHEAVRNYALFENWRGVERPLKGRSRFMKLWRDWGEESPNVELTMRKIDSSVKDDVMYGTLSRRKNRIKDWFKTKDKKSKNVSKSMHNINHEMHNVHDDSSILAQNKDNMFCAFSCYKKKAHRNGGGGLRERDTNIQTPFEKPRTVAVVQPRASAYQNPVYDTVTPVNPPLSKHYSMSQITQYGSRTSLKQTYVTKQRSCYFEDDEESDPVYSTAIEPVYPTERYYHKSSPPTKPRNRRLPQNVLDWDYDNCNRQNPYDSESGAESESEYRQLIRETSKSDYNDTRFKSLLNLVLSQERKIQEQFSRIKQSDRRIEEYEMAMHQLRTVEQGQDYLQDTYLSAHDETITEEGIRTINELGNMCDRVTAVDDKIREQYERLHDLSLQLDNEAKQLEESIRGDGADLNNTTQTEGPFESTRLSPNSKPNIDPQIQAQIASLRNDLQRSISMSIAQQNEIKTMDQNLIQYQSEVKSKQDQLTRLVNQVETSQTSQSSDNYSEIAFQNNPGNNNFRASNSGANLISSSAVQSHVPRAMTRQLKSLSDLQSQVSHTKRPVFQPGMRKSISDLRETLQNHKPASVFDMERRMLSSGDRMDFENAMRSLAGSESSSQCGKSRSRSLLPMPPVDITTPQQSFTEMGIDVGGGVSRVQSKPPSSANLRNETDDIKHQYQFDPNCEVKKIMSLRTPVLTPIKEQDFTHTILEYHNETVDLDTLMNKPQGRSQNPTKMFNEKDCFKPIEHKQLESHQIPSPEHKSSQVLKKPLVELIYDADAVQHINAPYSSDETETVASAGDRSTIADLSLNSDAGRSAFLPPLGIEAMSNIMGRKLMPSILDDTTRDAETLDITNNTTQGISENTSVWGTPCANDKINKTETAQNKTGNCTSIWNSQDNAPDGTFTVLSEPKQILKSIPEVELAGELTMCGDNTIADSTESSALLISAELASAQVIRKTIASSLGMHEDESPIKPLSSVKKRLFSEDSPSSQTENTTTEEQFEPEVKLAQIVSPEDTRIDSSSDQETKPVEIMIPEVTRIDSSLSPLSTTTESTESGVGSMPNSELHDEQDLCSPSMWSSTCTTNSFSETTV